MQREELFFGKETTLRGDDFSFEIKEHIGVIGTYPTGWKKEINLVEWNGNPAKLEIGRAHV